MTNELKSHSYRIRVHSDDFEVEVEAPDREYVDRKVAELLGWVSSDSIRHGYFDPTERGIELPVDGTSLPSLLEHVRLVDPRGGLEYVLAVGYYLQDLAGMAGGFRRRDLAQAFEAIEYSHSNPGVPISAGRKQGLLIDGLEREKMRLSDAAQQWVQARLRGE